MVSLSQAKTAFVQVGWRLDHTSKSEGRITSHYFARFETVSGTRKQVRVRVSDHHLGETVYGQPQGQNLDLDLVVSDFDAAATGADFVEIASNRDAYADYGVTGIAPSTDPDEWAEALQAQQ